MRKTLNNPGWEFLTKSEKRIFLKLSVVGSVLNIFDVIGVLLFGLIGTLAVNYISGLILPSSVENVLRALNLSEFDSIKQIYILGVTAVFFFLFKTLMQLIVSNRVYNFLSQAQARVSKVLTEQIISAPYNWTRKQSLNNLSYSIIEGVNSLVTGVIGNYFVIVSESVLLVLILSLLIMVNPVTAIVTSIFLILSSLLFMQSLKKYSLNLGKDFSETAISSRNYLEVMLKAYREVYVLEKRAHYVDLFNVARVRNSKVSSKIVWLQQLPKAWADILLILGGLLIAFYQVSTNDAMKSVSYLLLFLTASSRLLPSLIKLQSATTSTRNYLSSANLSLQVWSEIKDYKKLDFSSESEIRKPTSFSGPVEIQVSNVVFSYPDSISEIVNVQDLKIESGSVSAIVGRSGAGKSTFVELLLNIYEPQQGKILFNGSSIPDWRSANPGKIGFVPQDTFLLQDTFINNVCLGTNDSDIDLNKVNELVDLLGLTELVDKLPNGLYSQISGIGNSISGGEKQRISIARALYNSPSLVIIDEATSNQDSETEHSIMDFIQQLRGRATILVIAHRLSSVQKADQVLLFEKGKIIDSGTFSELARSSSEFKKMISYLQIQT